VVAELLFASARPSDDDLHVRMDSPAIDAGNTRDIPADLSDINANGNTSEPIPIDLDGHSRLTNSAVDIGAYEATSLKPPIKNYIPLISTSG
jgi:hypothetical protein